MFRLQIKALDLTVWRSPSPMETRAFADAMQIADRMAQACRKPAMANCGATKSWVVEIVGETGNIFYRSPVACA
jgi:hypothetical protein